MRTSSAGRLAGAGWTHDTERPDLETASDGYARRFDTAVGRYLLERQTMVVSRLLAAAGSRRLSILDVGGGHGQIIDTLASRGHDVVVHGTDEHCFRRLAAPAARWPGQITTCVSPLWSIPFEDRAFDLVMGIRLLAHVVRWRELLLEMTRLSSRFLLLDFPIHESLHRMSGAMFGIKRRVERNTRPYFSYRLEDIRIRLDELDFRVLRQQGQFVLPMVAHRFMRAPGLSRNLEGVLCALGLGSRWGSPVLLLAGRVSGNGGQFNPGCDGGGT
ncbi:MAG: class I SAM-dependent methyltransferase [Gemmatimonadaceae bacterium]